MAEKKPNISPLINLNSSIRKPNPMAGSGVKQVMPAPTVAQPYKAPQKAAAPKTVDPQFGVTAKKKAVATMVAKKKKTKKAAY